MLVSEIATHIAENTSLTVATDLFIGNLPDSPDELAAVYDTGGAESHRYIPTEQPTFQVMIRSNSKQDSFDLAGQIHSLLHQITNQTLDGGGSTHLYYVFDMGRPAFIGQDEKNRFEYSMNFNCRIRA